MSGARNRVNILLTQFSTESNEAKSRCVMSIFASGHSFNIVSRAKRIFFKERDAITTWPPRYLKDDIDFAIVFSVSQKSIDVCLNSQYHGHQEQKWMSD